MEGDETRECVQKGKLVYRKKTGKGGADGKKERTGEVTRSGISPWCHATSIVPIGRNSFITCVAKVAASLK